jgi:hypothetical protein
MGVVDAVLMWNVIYWCKKNAPEFRWGRKIKNVEA